MTTTNAQAVASKGVTITAFHKDAYSICNTARTAMDKAQGTMSAKLGALITSKYGTTAPTFEQFRADRAALKQLAVEKGLVDDQWLRKPFNAAIIALYGKLPEAQTAAAIAKRALREKEEAAKKAAGVSTGKATPTAPKAGAPKGETTQRVVSETETIEQYIARVGLWKVMDACARLCNADQSTQDVAKALQPLVKKHLKAA